MPSLGPTELIVILVIVLVVFGPGKLPDIGKSLGKSIKEFRKATDSVTSEVNETVNVVKKPIDDLKRPFDDIRKMPSEILSSATAGSPREKAAETESPTEKAAETDSAKVDTKTCPECSAPSPSSQSFCGKCGARFA